MFRFHNSSSLGNGSESVTSMYAPENMFSFNAFSNTLESIKEPLPTFTNMGCFLTWVRASLSNKWYVDLDSGRLETIIFAFSNSSYRESIVHSLSTYSGLSLIFLLIPVIWAPIA